MSRRARSIRRAVVWALLLAAVAAGIWAWARPRPVSVAVWTVGRGPVEATVANTRAGTVEARRRAKLAPATGGRVDRLPVREGERVETGAVLLELWNEDLRAELELARAQTTAARARAESACRRAELAERDATRLQRLSEDELAAEEALDRARTEAQTAAAACRAAEAEVEVRAAQVASVQARLDLTVLRAPFAGVVAELAPEVGEFVTPSPPGIPTPPAVDLVDPEDLYVLAPIDEVDAPRVRLGMPVRVTLDAFGDRVFAGRVLRIAPYVLDVEKQARTVDVEVELIGAEAEALLPGYSADVEIVLAVHEDVVRVPTEAVREGGIVQVVGPEGTVAEREVEIGIASWEWSEVVSGLRPSDRVVVESDRPLQTGVEVVARPPADRP